MSSKVLPDSDSIGLKETDVERQAHDTSYLDNSVVKSLAWSDVNITVRDRETKKPKRILSDVSGYVVAGEISSKLKFRKLYLFLTSHR